MVGLFMGSIPFIYKSTSKLQTSEINSRTKKNRNDEQRKNMQNRK